MNDSAEEPRPKLLPGVYFRPDPDVRRGVDRVAREERRTLSNTVNALLAEALKARLQKAA